MKTINHSLLGGEIKAIPSKSYAHRALICAALAEKPSRVYFSESSEDIDRTIDCLVQLGAKITRDEDGALVSPILVPRENAVLDVGESGSTLRFLLPVAAALPGDYSFTGSGRLPERPITELIQLLREGGAIFEKNQIPLTVSGKFKGGSFSLPGDVSSQYISGLLMASPLFEEDLVLTLKSPLESKGYVDMTLEVIQTFGGEAKETEAGYIAQNEPFWGCEYLVEGDWSNAAFFLVAGALGPGVRMTGLKKFSRQGDSKILPVLRDFGAKVHWEGEVLIIEGDLRRPVQVDLSEMPDSLPALSLLAASVQEGVSRFYNGKRLRLKESDRLHSVATMIKNLGGQAIELGEELKVIGTGGLTGGRTDSFGDHRIAMATAIAASISTRTIELENPEAVNKSYPKFFEDYQKLGGQIHD
ncbi:MAG: 3-phosphoshikimate 1-carboxyvinyltransferase [Tissierellia bacterium]|nr:3-phosphoshikimate 1-carboxyvinyltransferase [Tissierellia bacterium]